MIEALFRLWPVRAVAGAAFLARGVWHRAWGHLHPALSDYCWIYRVSGVGWLRRRALAVIRHDVARLHATTTRPLRESFRAGAEARRVRDRYALGGRGELELFKDLIVLKSPAPHEKGVLLIKYALSHEAFQAFFDVERILERYYVVLEMSWSGTCHPTYLLYVDPKHKVVVQTPESDDHDFVADLGVNLVPVRLGSGDWADPTDYNIPLRHWNDRTYDLVMVANWARHKNHRYLFRALRRLRDREPSVLLIGFPWQGRSKEHVIGEFRRELGSRAARYKVELHEYLPHDEVLRRVADSRVSLLLSRKEGHNKAIMESLLLGTPAIVYDRHLGGAREKINPETGLLASLKGLPYAIRDALDHGDRFTPRQWALVNTGCIVSTRILNDCLRQISIADGGIWRTDIVEKSNSPNLRYSNPSDRGRFQADYEFILACRDG